MSDKIYCGNGKEKTFQDGGSIISVMLDLDTLEREFANYGFTTDQKKRKIRINVGKRREVDQYGNTHLISIDTWKPAQQGHPASKPAPGNDDGFQDEIPW